MITRRNALIGLGVAGAGTLAGLDNFTDVLEDSGGSNIGSEPPPLTDPDNGNNTGTDEPAFQTPWNKDSLVIGFTWDQPDSTSDFLEESGFDELQNAVAFWNDYIESNAAFDLTLTFNRTHENPDILIRQATVMDSCSPEYKSPATRNQDLQPEVCADTLREAPEEDDLPVSAVIGLGGSGKAVYRLVAQHAIGRVLGYDIWSDPVSVMGPEPLTTPSHALSTENTHIYRDLSHHDGRNFLVQNDVDIEPFKTPGASTRNTLTQFQKRLTEFVNEYTNEMSEWHDLVDELGLPVYAEAYAETIENADIAYVNETIALIKNLLDAYTQEELANGPAELDTLVDRIETMQTWPDTTEPYDLRVHRYASRELWSAWAAEQTPAETENVSD